MPHHKYRKVRIDLEEVNNCVNTLRQLLNTKAGTHIHHSLINAIRDLIASGDLKLCIANLATTITAREHIISFGVCGRLEEIALAARASAI